MGEYIKKRKIILTNLNKENIDRKYYSNMFTSEDFWNSINSENILIFQTDTCLCSKKLKNINYYVNLVYGYISKPLKKMVIIKMVVSL